MTTASEISALTAEPDVLTLETGDRIIVQRLKTRQMFRLLKILTHGAGGALVGLDFSGEDPEGFVAQLLAITIAAIPNAEDETIEFIQSMVDSADAIEVPRSKGDRERNQIVRENLADHLSNPSLDDLITILEVVIRKEAPEIAALGKRLGALLQTTLGNAPQPSVEEKPKRSSRSTSKA